MDVNSCVFNLHGTWSKATGHPKSILLTSTTAYLLLLFSESQSRSKLWRGFIFWGRPLLSASSLGTLFWSFFIWLHDTFLSWNLGFPSPLTFLYLLLFSICGHSPRFILSSLTSGQYILLLLDEIYMSTEYRSFHILSSNVFTILFYNIHFCYKNLKTNKMDEIHKKC